MTMAAGTECYNADVAPITARGAMYTEAELDEALKTSVVSIIWDEPGAVDLRAILSSLVTTDFSEESVKRILSNQTTPENWRVGEGLAEGFLTEHRNCEFPWPAGRDLRNPRSSPAGTDLVGFQKCNGAVDSWRFAFGEVKTSKQKAWPPAVVDGRCGLAEQIEGLRNTPNVKDNLVKYLCYHAQDADWDSHYREAARRYLVNLSSANFISSVNGF